MARAKRTDRAEARRRHRAEIAAAAAIEVPEEEEAAPEPSPAPGRRGPAPRPAEPPGQRRGTLRAFRDAYQPADIRGDLRALPELIRSRAVWLPALLILITTILFVVTVATAPGTLALPGASSSPDVSATPAASASPGASGSGDTTGSGSGTLLATVTSIMGLLFLARPPIGGIYLAAILAKRSSYLAGAIAGFLGTLGLIVGNLIVDKSSGALPVGQIVYVLVESTIFGMLIGAGLGYYRRLLRLMNPTPNRPPNRPKPAARRR